jgi:hypothetical protein
MNKFTTLVESRDYIIQVTLNAIGLNLLKSFRFGCLHKAISFGQLEVA